MSCCQNKVNRSPNVCINKPTFFQVIGSGLPLGAYIARRTKPEDVDRVMDLIRAHKELTMGAREIYFGGSFRSINGKATWTNERKRFEFHSILRSIKEVEASFPEEVVNSERDFGCCCTDPEVLKVARFIIEASMSDELNIHGRCPPCRDARINKAAKSGRVGA